MKFLYIFFHFHGFLSFFFGKQTELNKKKLGKEKSYDRKNDEIKKQTNRKTSKQAKHQNENEQQKKKKSE